VGKKVPGPHPNAKTQHCGFEIVGLQPPKFPKLAIFGINLLQRGMSLCDCFTKFGRGEGVPSPCLHVKFHHCAFTNVGLQPPKSLKLVIFGINFPQRCMSP